MDKIYKIKKKNKMAEIQGSSYTVEGIKTYKGHPNIKGGVYVDLSSCLFQCIYDYSLEHNTF